MVYPLGVPNPIDIVATSCKLFKLYEEARGRQAKLNAANELLSSIGSAIDRVEQAGDNEHANKNGSALAQVRTARKAWTALHEYLQKFPVSDEQSHRFPISQARSVYDDLRWAINILDGKVSELKQELALSLLAAMPTQIADLQASMALLTTSVSELRSAAMLQTTTKQRLLVRESHSPAFCSGKTAADTPIAVPLETSITVPCWAKKGGCHCRCHSKTSTNPMSSPYVCIETQGWQAFGRTCNVEKCNARFVCVRLRLAASRIWVPWAINIALRLDANSAIPRLSFTPSRVCSYTSPGFPELTKMEEPWGMRPEERLASFKALFSSGQASRTDVCPDGDGYLDLILRRPWSPCMRKLQRDLVKFIIVEAPESVLRKPRLLYHCASWIGYGSHMDMLATLLSCGLDPEHLDPSLFFTWPRYPDSGDYPLSPVSDPMFINFLRACLQRQPGFAGCDDLTEALLVGGHSEFESALRRAKGESGILRTPANALGQTATHLAISSPGRLQRLLAAGADPDCVDRRGLTPLMYAAAYGEQQSTIHLVEYQATWNLKERHSRRNFLDYDFCCNIPVIGTFIRFLREKGDHSIAFEVLDHCIAYCVQHCYSEPKRLHRLFELGADADTIVKGQTLMHFAWRLAVSQLIVEAGFTSFHFRDEHGKTPLMQVAHLVDAKTLANVASHDQNVDFTARDARGWTALHCLLGSHHVYRLYNNSETDKKWHVTQHRNMISCIVTLLQHGSSAFLPDNCVCACSDKGCTVLTFAMHQLSRFLTIDCGVVIDLLQAIRHQREPQNVSGWPAAVKRYHAFEEQGLTHTCCHGREECTSDLSYRLHPDTLAQAKAEQMKAMANFHWDSRGNVCADDDIISSLAKLCFLFEQRSVANSKLSVKYRKRTDEQYLPQIQVDYTKGERWWGTEKCCIREVTMNRYKHWLRWCDRNFVKLDIEGGRQNYNEYGWHLVSMFEDKVDELRSGTETWHTAPEQPAEAQ